MKLLELFIILIFLIPLSYSFPLNLDADLTIPTGQARDVKIGDLNNDGLNDILVGNYAEGTGMIFYQKEDNSFGLQPDIIFYTQQGFVWGVDIGDLNDDGLNDIVIANEIYYQNNDNTIDTQRDMLLFTATYGQFVKIGDVNNDNLNDVIMANEFFPKTFIFLQNTNRTFDVLPDFYISAEPYDDIAIGDLNNDGLNDILQGNDIFYQKNNNTFSYSPDFFFSESGITKVFIDDLNDDNLNDVLIGNKVFLQNKNNTFDYLPDIALERGSIRVISGYFDNDNLKDIASDDYVFFQQDNFTFPVTSSKKLNTDANHDSAFGDLNNDGLQDLVFSGMYVYHVQVFYQEKCYVENGRVSCRYVEKLNDSDDDNIPDEQDNCPYTYNSWQWDDDNDGIGNFCDNCVLTYNPNQIDADNNERGDACEGCSYDRCLLYCGELEFSQQEIENKIDRGNAGGSFAFPFADQKNTERSLFNFPYLNYFNTIIIHMKKTS